MTPIFSFLLSRLLFEVSTGVNDVNQYGGLVLGIAAVDGLLMGVKFLMQTLGWMWIERLHEKAFGYPPLHLLRSSPSPLKMPRTSGCTCGVASGLIYPAEALLFYVGAVLVARGTYTYLQMIEVLDLVVYVNTDGHILNEVEQEEEAGDDDDPEYIPDDRESVSEGSSDLPPASFSYDPTYYQYIVFYTLVLIACNRTRRENNNAMFKCTICGKQLPTEHGRRTHEGSCKKRKAVRTNLFDRHKKARVELAEASSHAGQVEDAPIENARTPSPDIPPVSPQAFDPTMVHIPSPDPPPVSPPAHDPAPEAPPIPEPGKRMRNILPSRFADYQRSSESAFRRGNPKDGAAAPTQVPPSPSPILVPSPTPSLPEEVDDIFETEPNENGLFRVYRYNLPSRDPDLLITIQNTADAPTFACENVRQSSRTPGQVFGPRKSPSTSPSPSPPPDNLPSPDPWAPFQNVTTFRLMDWTYTHDSLSAKSIDNLVHNVILQEDFDVSHLTGFSAQREFNRMDHHENPPPVASSSTPAPVSTSSASKLPFSGASAVWKTSPVKVSMPCINFTWQSEELAPKLEVPVHHQQLTEVLKTSFEGNTFFEFHIKPYKQFWKPSDDEPAQRVISESYSSTRALEIEREVYKSLPKPADPNIETIIAWAMLWSDSTHLANFGTASLWPIYLYFGNLSKYTRCKPSAYAANHIAYIPKFADVARDEYRNQFGKDPTAEVMRFLHRELFQAVWLLLLDTEFMEAYVHGLLICCADGIVRRVFLRFFSYSADYPEKILIVCIKYLAKHPSPRSLVLKSEISQLGLKRDMKNRITRARKDSEQHQYKIDRARKLIFEKGTGVESTAVNALLDSESLTAAKNSFAKRLLEYGFDIFKLLPPDILHEFELGKFKDVLIHILRILHALKDDSVSVLDQRYRWVPTFRRSTIRRFHNNVSELKKLGGRDYEDILESSMPCFEGMIHRPYDDLIQDLLFTLNCFEAYGKFRMHWDSSLASYDDVVVELGHELRRFTKKSEDFQTEELPREKAARMRRKTTQAGGIQVQSKKPKTRRFNNSTVKTNLLGDYPTLIRYFGTTDGNCTKIGEGEHKRPKRFYSRTNKNRFTIQATRHENRSRMLRKIRCSVPTSNSTRTRRRVALGPDNAEQLPLTDPSLRYHMAGGKKYFEDIPSLVQDNEGDPAMENFLDKLKDHVLRQLLDVDDPTNFTPADRSAVLFENNQLYRHKVVRINYTTYDLRRDQDSINPRTHPHIITLSPPGTDHPFTYGRVIGVFHANVRLQRVHGSNITPTNFVRINFLWVRWFRYDSTYKSGWKAKRLHRIQFYDGKDPTAFGFLDPALVVRGVHIIPGFHYGGASGDNPDWPWAEYLPEDSIARQYETINIHGKLAIETDDWVFHYVNIFGDRDLFNLFRGGGIGHQHLRAFLKAFAEDAGLNDQVLPRYHSDWETDDEGDEDIQSDDSESVSSGVDDDEEAEERSNSSASEEESEHSQDFGPEDEEGDWEDDDSLNF
ncbi:hypothetical protein BT96DRAFT_1025149 [Gymnopus androsaceus JB14]|uniref:C2H2-type domain-containing protein n=1 Tax=Gymnopus androsaceus JB14 TaxID=1447944 RepID=A0A6A4GU23_9AGAR|nr:hypothetical protein BT96DRAFT_1025149 [Gymnopus androsaceus JB14]